METDNNNVIQEEFRTLEEFPYIKISNLGKIYKVPHGRFTSTSECGYHYDKDGYKKVTVYCPTYESNKHNRTISVHQLVARAFVENDNPEIRKCVNHIDGDRTNNQASNLEWVTPRENVRHSILYGNRKLVREVPHKSTLTEYQISQIDILRSIYNVKELAKLFNVKYTTMKNIIRKKKQSEILDNQQPNPKYVVGEVQRV